MALIQCQECKQEISDKASVCPHCGAPQTPSASAPPPPPSAPPSAPPPPGPAAPRSRSGAWLLTGLLVLVFGGYAVVQLSRNRHEEAPAVPPPPAPKWLVDNVDANESCTQLGEYCIRVRCAVTNAGTASGVAQVAAELKEDSVAIGTRRGTRPLDVGQQDTLTLDFPEANLGKEHSFRCYSIP